MAFADDFSNYPQDECFGEGDTFGPWTSVFAGFGCNSVVDVGGASALSLSPKGSTEPGETHSALVTGPNYVGNVQFSAGVTSAEQLRQGSDPNPWEVAWLIWHFTDAAHFYYFVAKPNGWELGKRDPAYRGGQRFLQTGTEPAYAVGNRHEIQIEQAGATLRVAVNGAGLANFTDDERPYRSGRIGFYVEDAIALFDGVSARGG